MAQISHPIALALLALPLALAGAAAAASPLDGCWKMVPARAESPRGKAGAPAADCIRVYKDTTLVTSCRGGKDVSVYALADMNVSAYSFQQVGRYVDGREARVDAAPPRPAAFLIKGPALFMVLAGSGARTEQQLARLKDQDCESLRRYLPQGGAAAEESRSRP
jgi:hypothetical protein